MTPTHLKSTLAIGDIVVLTTVVRELKRRGVSVSVETPFPDIWENNPTPSQEQGSKVIVPSYYESIERFNASNRHFAAGFLRNVSHALGLVIAEPKPLTDIRPSIWLTSEEKEKPPLGIEKPYWIMMPGGKLDFRSKWWDIQYFQQVVNILKGQIQFVTVGSLTPPYNRPVQLSGTTDLMGKTSIRQLLTLIYHSDGVLCPVTCGLHIAAAFNKPCVVVAGGLEPYWWEAYTTETWKINCSTPVPEDLIDQTFLHSIGKMPCCKYGGCSRPDIKSSYLSRNCRIVENGPSGPQAGCMKRITPEQVVKAVLAYNQTKDERNIFFPEKSLSNIGSPVTICTTLYGGPTNQKLWSQSQKRWMSYTEMHQRAVRSIIDNTRSDTYELRIGCNQVHPDTTEWLEDYAEEHSNLKAFSERVNIGKEPMMRRLFANDSRDTPTILGKSPAAVQDQIVRDDYLLRGNPCHIPLVSWKWHSVPIDLKTEWLVWLDDDAYIVDPNWLYRLDELIGNLPQETACIGYEYSWGVDLRQLSWMTGRKWWSGQLLPPTRLNDGIMFETRFCTGAFWAIRTSVLKELNWPDPGLQQTNDDALLGEALRQQGYNILGLKEKPVVIEDVKRRGLSQPPAGLTGGSPWVFHYAVGNESHANARAADGQLSEVL